jgi:hypothetical protein
MKQWEKTANKCATTLKRNDTQHKDPQHNILIGDTQKNDPKHERQSVYPRLCIKCHYAVSLISSIVMLNVVMLGVVTQSVIAIDCLRRLQ